MSCDIAVTCLFIITKRKKEKEIQKKRNIKSRKIDKIKRKMLVFEAFHNKICVIFTNLLLDPTIQDGSISERNINITTFNLF